MAVSQSLSPSPLPHNSWCLFLHFTDAQDVLDEHITKNIWLPSDTNWFASRWTTNEVPNKIPLCCIRCRCAAYFTEFRLLGKCWKKWVNKVYYCVLCIDRNIIQVFDHECFFQWSVQRVRRWSRWLGLKNWKKVLVKNFKMCTGDYYNQGCLLYPKKILLNFKTKFGFSLQNYECRWTAFDAVQRHL